MSEAQGIDLDDQPGAKSAHRRDSAPRSCGADSRQDEHREDRGQPGDAKPSKHAGIIGRSF